MHKKNKASQKRGAQIRATLLTFPLGLFFVATSSSIFEATHGVTMTPGRGNTDRQSHHDGAAQPESGAGSASSSYYSRSSLQGARGGFCTTSWPTTPAGSSQDTRHSTWKTTTVKNWKEEHNRADVSTSSGFAAACSHEPAMSPPSHSYKQQSNRGPRDRHGGSWHTGQPPGNYGNFNQAHRRSTGSKGSTSAEQVAPGYAGADVSAQRHWDTIRDAEQTDAAVINEWMRNCGFPHGRRYGYCSTGRERCSQPQASSSSSTRPNEASSSTWGNTVERSKDMTNVARREDRRYGGSEHGKTPTALGPNVSHQEKGRQYSIPPSLPEQNSGGHTTEAQHGLWNEAHGVEADSDDDSAEPESPEDRRTRPFLRGWRPSDLPEYDEYRRDCLRFSVCPPAPLCKRGASGQPTTATATAAASARCRKSEDGTSSALALHPVKKADTVSVDGGAEDPRAAANARRQDLSPAEKDYESICVDWDRFVSEIHAHCRRKKRGCKSDSEVANELGGSPRRFRRARRFLLGLRDEFSRECSRASDSSEDEGIAGKKPSRAEEDRSRRVYPVTDERQSRKQLAVFCGRDGSREHDHGMRAGLPRSHIDEESDVVAKGHFPDGEARTSDNSYGRSDFFPSNAAVYDCAELEARLGDLHLHGEGPLAEQRQGRDDPAGAPAAPHEDDSEDHDHDEQAQLLLHAAGHNEDLYTSSIVQQNVQLQRSEQIQQAQTAFQNYLAQLSTDPVYNSMYQRGVVYHVSCPVQWLDDQRLLAAPIYLRGPLVPQEAVPRKSARMPLSEESPGEGRLSPKATGILLNSGRVRVRDMTPSLHLPRMNLLNERLATPAPVEDRDAGNDEVGPPEAHEAGLSHALVGESLVRLPSTSAAGHGRSFEEQHPDSAQGAMVTNRRRPTALAKRTISLEDCLGAGVSGSCVVVDGAAPPAPKFSSREGPEQALEEQATSNSCGRSTIQELEVAFDCSQHTSPPSRYHHCRAGSRTSTSAGSACGGAASAGSFSANMPSSGSSSELVGPRCGSSALSGTSPGCSPVVGPVGGAAGPSAGGPLEVVHLEPAFSTMHGTAIGAGEGKGHSSVVSATSAPAKRLKRFQPVDQQRMVDEYHDPRQQQPLVPNPGPCNHPIIHNVHAPVPVDPQQLQQVEFLWPAQQHQCCVHAAAEDVEQQRVMVTPPVPYPQLQGRSFAAQPHAPHFWPGAAVYPTTGSTPHAELLHQQHHMVTMQAAQVVPPAPAHGTGDGAAGAGATQQNRPEPNQWRFLSRIQHWRGPPPPPTSPPPLFLTTIQQPQDASPPPPVVYQ
ncbi:unnamed protein product [Amoebophrya sp. A120]|nr:unnamed protein product [Amoebophrya sp. A120]|eukprot:GSA120T00025254001.1